MNALKKSDLGKSGHMVDRRKYVSYMVNPDHDNLSNFQGGNNGADDLVAKRGDFSKFEK